MSTALAEFVAPWRAAFPALELAHLYSSEAESDRLLARAILLMECADAVWRASDPKVTMAKLGWWVEEWDRMGRGEARHPLASVLAPGKVEAPLRALLRETEDVPTTADWAARLNAHRQIGEEYASAFPVLDCEGPQARQSRALCWTVLISGRYLAALASGLAPAVRAAPLATRARFQLSAEATASAVTRQAAAEGALHIAAALRSQFAALPTSHWRGQRGARVLTAMAIRELAEFDQPSSRWTTIAKAWNAWRVARAV